MPGEFATKSDHICLERKVDALHAGLTTISSDVRSIREGLEARDRAEKQAQVLMAEVAAARATAAAEKAENAEGWMRFKTRALWIALGLLAILSVPGAAEAVKTLKGLTH